MTGSTPFYSPTFRMTIQVLDKAGKFRRPLALALNHETTQQRTNEETKMIVLATPTKIAHQTLQFSMPGAERHRCREIP